MVINVYIENNKFYEHIKYSIQTMMRCINIYDVIYQDQTPYDEKMTGIYYGKKKPKYFEGIFIQEAALFQEPFLSIDKIPTLPLKRYKNVPIIYMNEIENRKPCVEQEDSVIIINFDIVQSAFFILSGYEEIVNEYENRDEHGRYLIEKRILYKENYLHIPIVNEYAKMLKEWLNIWGMEWDMRSKGCYAHISHDVDLPYSIYWYRLNKMIKEKFHVTLTLPIDSGCRKIIREEKKIGLKSSWYFMTDAHNEQYDYQYCIKNKEVENLIEQLEKQGCDVGWHYSYDAAWNDSIFQNECEKFKENTKKANIYGRNHYLRYSVPDSWRSYAKAGLVYDASLGNAQHEGFVYGICIPFQLFDAKEGENLQVWEIPLVIMDGTLRNEKYRNFTRKQAIHCLKEYIKIVKRYDGCISVLWHNSSLDTTYWWKWKKVYREYMRILARECKCETGMEIVNAYMRKTM